MNSSTQFEDRASRSRSKHEGESSSSLCDRHSRTRDLSQRQLPTDQDYAVSTREYQTDQSSLTPALAAAGPVLDQRQKQRQQQKPHRCAEVDRVTPYQGSSAQGPDFLTAWSCWGKMSSVGRFSSGCMHLEAGIPASRRTTARVLPVVCGAYTDSQGRSSRTAGDGFWPGPYI